MKKIILLIIFLVSISLISAITLNNKQEAINYLRNYKESILSTKKVSEITLTTDKICRIDYETEIVYCNICFEFTYEKDNNINRGCVNVLEDSITNEDNQKIQEFVLDDLARSSSLNPIDVEFVKELRKGEKFDLIKK